MAFWKTFISNDPLNQRDIPKKASEYEWEAQLEDVKKDIEGINMVLNELKRKQDAFEISFHSIKERDCDAIELKKTFMEVLERVGYVKVQNDR